MKMFCFKFNQNRTINKEFDFWGGQILSGGPEGGRGTRLKKILRSLVQISGPNPHRKFPHSSSIRKCLKIGGTDSTFGRLIPCQGGDKGT